ncbi:MAG: tig, trigger factor, trigger factor [Candidatus Taylorbacteria bacterium]|nr:tig, trigger factor, trigger factor [Candidatus Taylorbacteria bacterium]
MYTIKKVEKKEGSEVEIYLEIAVEAIEKKWSKALQAINDSISMDGFRKGHIPEKTLIEKVGEITVLEEAAELAIHEVYPDVLKEKEIKAIGNPKVVITKIAKGSPLEVTITTAVLPEIKLADYKKIASKAKTEKITPVTEDEYNKVIEELKSHKFHSEHGHDHDNHDHGEVVIDDAFVKGLGDFKDMDDFKAKVMDNLKKEKEYKAKEKARIDTLEAIRKDSKVEVPNILIESELDRMSNEFNHHLSRMGATLEQYLKDTKKTEEDMRVEWKDKATERVQNELILLDIAKIEKIDAKKEDIEREADAMEAQYPGTPKERIEAFVEEVLIKEEVFKFLEEQAK